VTGGHDALRSNRAVRGAGGPLRPRVQLPGTASLVVNGSLTLTDAQDAVVAEALGTVCNRIFGSGNTTPNLGAL